MKFIEIQDDSLEEIHGITIYCLCKDLSAIKTNLYPNYDFRDIKIETTSYFVKISAVLDRKE